MGENNNVLLPMFVFLIVALAGMYVISMQDKAQNVYLSPQPIEHTISVTGEASTKVTPNLAQISLRVETNDTVSAKVAQEKNAEIIAKIKTALLAKGLTEKDIETIEFSVTPIKISRWKCIIEGIETCDYYDRVYYEELVGYKATHRLFIKSEDTAKTGELLDALAEAGGNQIQVDHVSFTLKDETKKEIERRLLEQAAKDAKEKAQKIVAGTGNSLGKAVSAYESVVYPYYYDYGYAEKAALTVDAGANKLADTQIFSSDVEVTARVNVNFEIQ